VTSPTGTARPSPAGTLAGNGPPTVTPTLTACITDAVGSASCIVHALRDGPTTERCDDRCINVYELLGWPLAGSDPGRDRRASPAGNGAVMGHKRTNIEIDEGLVAEAMERYGTRTMRETVDLALRVLVGEPMSTEDALALRGSGWEGDLEQQRAGWDGTRGGSLAAIDGTTADATSTAE